MFYLYILKITKNITDMINTKFEISITKHNDKEKEVDNI